MEDVLPQLKITLSEKEAFDPFHLFEKRAHEVWLEIGFGGGEHLAQHAAQNPAIGFIGCEPFINGIASLLDHIEREKLTNIRIFPDDARHLLDALPPHSIARCFVLFPDPWPKARHEKRRFIGPENKARLARVLKKGAALHLATDHPTLAAWMFTHLEAAEEFTPVLKPSETPPAPWIKTRYEEKALKAGRKPLYAIYRRL
jgi:tRNA (guanine-N7-)-methyltransferase